MVLLDSHVLLWRLDRSRELGAETLRLLDDADATYVSAATIWELTIKAMRGKLQMPEDFERRLERRGYESLWVTGQHAAGLRRFPELVRHDPFDRLLVSQADAEGLQLLTADRVLLGLGLDFVVDALS